MSRENVEIVRRAFDEFAHGGWERLIDTLWAPEIVWDLTPAGIPGLGTYRGYDEVRSLFEDWFGTFPFEEWAQELKDVIDCGDRVVALTRQHGRGASSGVNVELEYAQIITISEGKMVRVEVYLDRERALEAAGLKEQAMSQEDPNGMSE